MLGILTVADGWIVRTSSPAITRVHPTVSTVTPGRHQPRTTEAALTRHST